VFAKVTPALQQLGQVMSQFAPQPQVDPADQALLQASLAETQRRTARDQGDLQIAQQKLQNDMTQDEKDRQVKIAMNAENNLTTERLKTAELTVDELRLRKEQEQTAIKLQNVTQRNLGR
jgi:hypothetical protein